jgi:O-antigen/teichoic acid export membrane protein
MSQNAAPVTILARSKAAWADALHRTQFGSHFALTFATNLLLAVLALISGVLLARALGPAGRGELAAIQTWPTFLAGFAMLGIPDALVYFAARQPTTAGRYLTTSMLTGLVASIPAAAVGFMLMAQLLAAQSQAIVTGAQTYLWLLPLYALTGMLLQPLRGVNDMTAWNLLRPLPGLGWIAVIVIAIAAGNATPNALAVGNLAVLTLVAIPMGYVVKHRLHGSFLPSTTLVAPMLRYGLPTMLARIPATLNLRLDQLLMVAWVDSRLLGLYVVGVSWSTAVSPLISTLAQTLLPRVAGAGSTVQQHTLLSQGTRMGLLLAVIAAVPVALLTPVVIMLLFGTEYADAVPAAVILSLAAGADGYKQVLSSGAMSLGSPRQILIAELVGLTATVLLLPLLLVRYQILGAAMASFVSYSLACGVLVWLLARQTNLAWYSLVLPMRADFRLVLEKTHQLVKRENR